jgi:hypothetical protein
VGVLLRPRQRAVMRVDQGEAPVELADDHRAVDRPQRVGAVGEGFGDDSAAAAFLTGDVPEDHRAVLARARERRPVG